MPIYVVAGDTYPHRDALGKLKLRWHPTFKNWYLPAGRTPSEVPLPEGLSWAPIGAGQRAPAAVRRGSERGNGNGGKGGLAALFEPEPEPAVPVAADARTAIAEEVASQVDGVLRIVAGHVEEAMGAHAQRMAGLVEEAVQRHVRRIDIVLPGKTEAVRVEGAHEAFPRLVQLCSLRLNVLMVGPAGSGKTTAAREAAKLLGVPFDFTALGPMTTQSQVFGYMDAQGRYVPSAFRRIYEHGGVFLFDEMDAANAGVLTSINAAIENGHASFPDALVSRHKDAVFLAAANTYGRGADRLYVGRNQLDAATLDRFVVLDWPYDEGLERRLAGNDAWVDRVQEVRRAAEKHKLRVVVSPRASIRGAVLLAAGWDQPDVEQAVLWKGMDADTRAKLED